MSLLVGAIGLGIGLVGGYLFKKLVSDGAV